MWNGCPLYAQFNLDVSVWRYLPWSKFEDLLRTSSFFFTRADYLKEKFDDVEGEMTASEKDLIDVTLQGMHTYISNQGTPMGRISGIPFTGNRPTDLTAFRKNIENTYAYYLNNIYINCWHSNSEEDISMWKDYVPDGCGIAMHTTLRSLVKALDTDNENVIGAKVE
jgi:hypothetical protein